MIDEHVLVAPAAATDVQERPVRPVRRPVPRDMLVDFLRAFGLALESVLEGEEQVVIVTRRAEEQPDATLRVQEHTYELDLGATLGAGGSGAAPAPGAAPPPPHPRDVEAAAALGQPLPPGFHRVEI